MTILPTLKIFNLKTFQPKNCKRLLIASEGFEERSLTWIKSLPSKMFFENCLIFKNIPVRKSRLEELIDLAEVRTKQKADVLDYERFDPITSEFKISNYLHDKFESMDEIIVDLSVMSKLLIMIVVFLLRNYDKDVRFIYSEPTDYIPSEEGYTKSKGNMSSIVKFPTFGVHDVVRTPLLSSSIMQNSPSIVIMFTSFNEQLIRALLSNISPTHLFIISGIPPHLHWRSKATQEVHKEIIEEYYKDNPKSDDGLLSLRASTLNYYETFDILSEIYKKYCYSNRIILSPTGSKMQAIGAALFKICCPDVHIEYPTPESYFVDGFSSTKIRNIHEIYFQKFSSSLKETSEKQGLNG